jgi:hypothetical protein
MLTSAPTKLGAGITLYGDFFDLDSLYKTIHKIAEEGFMEESTRNFLLALAYDIRKAKESKRERKVLGFAEDKVKYRGVRILWPIFLSQLAMLRHYAGYRTTDHRDQACLYLLEDCAITSLLAFDAHIGHETAKLLLNLPPFPHDYLFEFCSVCAREYVSASVRENRFRTLPKTLRSMFWLSPGYQAFAKKMALLAEEKGCSPQSLEDATEWPRFQW